MGRRPGNDNGDKRLTDLAYQAIREAIVIYQLKPGEALKPADLAAGLAMSQTPVREALIRLELEEYVTRSGRGFEVSGLDLDQTAELYDLRLYLEVPAVRLAAGRLDSIDLTGLTESVAGTADLLEGGQPNQIMAQEQKFHALIMAASGNEILCRTGLNILDRVRRIQNLNLLTADRLLTAQSQHEGILTALKSGQGGRAVELMTRHLIESRDYLLTRLADDRDILSRLLTRPDQTTVGRLIHHPA